MLIISNIYVINENILTFKGDVFDIDLWKYEPHFRSHILTPKNTSIFIFYDDLKLYTPLHPRTTRVLPSHTIVILPFYVC